MDAWSERTREFSDALDLLRRKMGSVPKEEYDLLKTAVENSRLASDAARWALEVHIDIHGC